MDFRRAVARRGDSFCRHSADPTSLESLQDPKFAFLNGPIDRRTVSVVRLVPPASPYVLQPGSVIPAAFVTGIRSDLPGQVIVHVTENIYDSPTGHSPTGRSLLTPQGAKLVGQYASQISFAQSRVQLICTRLILADGATMVLEHQSGADTEGYSGLEDDVDDHLGALFKAATLSTFLSVGSEAETPRPRE